LNAGAVQKHRDERVFADCKYDVHYLTIVIAPGQTLPGRILGKVAVSIEGGETPRWGPSVRELFYMDPMHNQLMAVDVQSGPELHVGHPRALFALHSIRPTAFMAWREGWDVAPDGQRFLAIASPENQESTVKLSVVVNRFDALRRRVPVGN
jgi:hypothetical protein